MRRLANIKFATYLRTLPWGRGFNAQEHVLFWKDQDVDALLKNSLAYEDATEIRSTVKMAMKVLNAIISPIILKARAEETESSRDKGGFRFPWQQAPDAKSSDDEVLDGLEDAVRGAFVILLSRAFAESVEGITEDRLKPLLDMLQHSNTPNVSHNTVDGGSIIEVKASKMILSGEELFNQYQNEEEGMPYHKFFTRFGFVPGVYNEPVADLIAARSTIFFPQRAQI
jgi:hypothetical protein